VAQVAFASVSNAIGTRMISMDFEAKSNLPVHFGDLVKFIEKPIFRILHLWQRPMDGPLRAA
jgi:hypothetical protein